MLCYGVGVGVGVMRISGRRFAALLAACVQKDEGRIRILYHATVRATTREAARPQPQGSEDATGYWAADSLLPPPLSLFFPFPLHLQHRVSREVGHVCLPAVSA